MPNQEDDRYSFVDRQFGGVDFRDDSEFPDELVAGATPEQKAEIDRIEAESAAVNAPAPVVEESTVEPSVEPVAEQPVAAAPVSQYPQHWPYPDGSSVLVEQTPSGLKATLDPANGGRIEVFHGRDENELLRQILPAKLNASKQIRKQAAELRLKVRNTDESPAPVAPGEQQPAPLTADEAFAFKTAFASDPAKAIEDFLKRRTGMSLDDITNSAREGKAAADAMYLEVEVKAFLAERPDYYNTYENYRKLVNYLSVAKLGQDLPDGDMESTLWALYNKGEFNRAALAEAYDTLSDDGLLQVKAAAPVQVTPVPVARPAVAPAPAPAAVQPKQPVSVTPAAPQQEIPAVRVRPRATPASYGLRQQSSQPVVVEQDQGVPTVEEMENMSNEDLSKLLDSVYAERARSLTRR